MTFREAIYDIKELIASYNLVEESKLTVGYCAHLISVHRGFIISEDYNRHDQIDPQLSQSVGVKKANRVDYSDNLETDGCTCYVGKITIPPIVNIRSQRQRIADIGLRIIKSTCGLRYIRTTEKRFFDLMSHHPERIEHVNLYWKVGNSLYTHPFRKELIPEAILEDIMDGKVIQTDLIQKGELVPTKVYRVQSGTITYNSVIYQRDDTFTPSIVNGVTWTGDGEVIFDSPDRAFTYDDEFPMNSQLWGYTKKRIIQELGVGSKFIGDTVSDAADEESMQESRQ